MLAVCVALAMVVWDLEVIESDAMRPSLWEGDVVLVDRMSHRFWAVDTGDVVVFESPLDASRELVGRVVAAEGDVVETEGRSLRINGEPTRLVGGGEYRWRAAQPDVEDVRLERLSRGEVERTAVLPDGSRHSVWVRTDTLYMHDHKSWQVPEGHVFVLGDRRDGALDSRLLGPVSRGAIRGQVSLVVRSAREEGGALGRYLAVP